MNDQVNFDQRPGETAEAWLARLRTVSQEGMTMQLRFNYLHRKEGAERLVKQSQQSPAPTRREETLPPGALESVKDAYQRLTREEQQQFALWLSGECRETDGTAKEVRGQPPHGLPSLGKM